VESLRSTSKALDARRRQLKSEGYGAQLSALDAQRTELLGRRELATDAIARTRLNSAIESLDNQAGALRQLVAATERVDGEYTSLLVLLQELRTRVAVARSTTSSTQLGGLRENVERLNDELEAITDAMNTHTPARLTGS
jgi:DNA repair exonuclease SbcCD ATPase subunit